MTDKKAILKASDGKVITVRLDENGAPLPIELTNSKPNGWHPLLPKKGESWESNYCEGSAKVPLVAWAHVSENKVVNIYGGLGHPRFVERRDGSSKATDAYFKSWIVSLGGESAVNDLVQNSPIKLGSKFKDGWYPMYDTGGLSAGPNFQLWIEVLDNHITAAFCSPKDDGGPPKDELNRSFLYSWLQQKPSLVADFERRYGEQSKLTAQAASQTNVEWRCLSNYSGFVVRLKDGVVDALDGIGSHDLAAKWIEQNKSLPDREGMLDAQRQFLKEKESEWGITIQQMIKDRLAVPVWVGGKDGWRHCLSVQGKSLWAFVGRGNVLGVLGGVREGRPKYDLDFARQCMGGWIKDFGDAKEFKSAMQAGTPEEEWLQKISEEQAPNPAVIATATTESATSLPIKQETIGFGTVAGLAAIVAFTAAVAKRAQENRLKKQYEAECQHR